VSVFEGNLIPEIKICGNFIDADRARALNAVAQVFRQSYNLSRLPNLYAERSPKLI